jgi:hypothetical protein
MYSPDAARKHSEQRGHSGIHRSPLQPRQTTFAKEREIVRLRIANSNNGSDTRWKRLAEWQKLAVAVIEHFTLNTKQKLFFLLKVDNRISRLDPAVERKPFRLIVGGSGGTGKSHVYDALRAFYDEVGLLHELTFTAPTGVAASNVGGSTTHSEGAIRVASAVLAKPNSNSLKALVARLEGTETFVIDEGYFLGCEDAEKLSRNLNLARACTDDPYGNLDIIFSGDEYQLTPPRATPLFDRAYISIFESNCDLNALSAKARRIVTAIKNFWTITDCVILDEVVRQKNPRFVELLNRLRRGRCTVVGEDSDLDYLRRYQLGSPGSVVDPSLTSISRWLDTPNEAAPLITYTNHVRNLHNWSSTEAFAKFTGQEFAVYYAADTVGRVGHQITLTGQNAIDAWNTPIKSNAKDLSGRLPLVVGMPIFVVDNIAVELGISKGSGGTLIGLKYEVRHGRRYAISVDVDIPAYTSSELKTDSPHRLTLGLIAEPITYKRRRSEVIYSARRHQLPIIAGFSCTAHNSQSRSLDAGVVHLASCTSTAAAYVMLSRIKCDEGEPKGLAILGDIDPKRISSHAPEQVRAEEKRLKALAKQTLRRAKDTLSWYTELTGEQF